MRIFPFLLSILIITSTNAQDRVEVDSNFLNMSDSAIFFNSKVSLDPNKSALLSAVLPGLGQAYNGQYWKIPIIYGGGMIFAHFIKYNHDLYNQFRTAEIAVKDNRTDTVNPFDAVSPGRYGESSITRNREAFRRNRDFLIILASAFYLVNVAEAHIAAHLKEFDVNESLSLSMRPSIQPTSLFSRSTGVSLVITF